MSRSARPRSRPNPASSRSPAKGSTSVRKAPSPSPTTIPAAIRGRSSAARSTTLPSTSPATPGSTSRRKSSPRSHATNGLCWGQRANVPSRTLRRPAASGTEGSTSKMGTVEKQVAASRQKPVPHLTRAERIARGKAARARAPRSAHAEVEFPEARDPIALLEEQAASRVPDLVPIRYGRMLASPFAFYRGGALIMAADLARTPASGLRVQSCGDAHLSNFGVFGSPERRLVFDINDFDETAPGPWEWDVKRLAASFAIGGRELGFSDQERRKVVLDTMRSYRETIAVFAGMSNLDVWYASLPAEQALEQFTRGIDTKQLKKRKADIAKARTKDSMHAFEKLTHVVDGERRIVSDPPLIVPIDELVPASTKRHEIVNEIHGLVRSYRRTLETDRRHLLEQFRFVDMARKVVGVGSVGTRAWIVLFQGVDLDDPLFLQVKEAQPSVLERFVGKSEYKNSGRRVVAGQRLMQANTDIFLGWQHVSSSLDGK